MESLRPLMPYVLQIVLRTKDETVRLDGVVFILSQFYLLPMAEVAKFIASPGLSVDPAVRTIEPDFRLSSNAHIP